MCEKIETSKHLLFSFFIVLYTIVQKTPLMPKATWQHVPMQLYRVSQKVRCINLELPRVRCNSRNRPKKSPNQTAPNLKGVRALEDSWVSIGLETCGPPCSPSNICNEDVCSEQGMERSLKNVLRATEKLFCELLMVFCKTILYNNK